MLVEDVATIFLSTLVSGAIYTIMVVGLTMIFETIRYFNWSHGALFTFGAYLVWYLFNVTKTNYLFAIIILIPVGFGVGFIIQTYFIQTLVDKKASDLILILATFCVGVLIQNIILIVFGGRLKRLPYLFEGHITFFQATMSYHKLMIFIISSLLVIIITTILNKTKVGLAMRAVAQDNEAAYLVGIDVKRIYAITLGISAVLACIGGWLMACFVFLTPSFGDTILSKGFIVCTLGGRKAGIKGSIMTSYLVAFIETTLQRYMPMYHVPPIVFAMVIMGLLIKPEGIFVRRNK